MKKIIIIMLAAFIISGCGGGSTAVPEIYKGTQGLSMKFFKDTPPEKVYEDDFFMIGLHVANEGPTDIRDGVIALGIEDNFVEVMSWDQEAHDIALNNLDYYRSSFSIDGKKMDRPIPREGLVVVKLKTHVLPDQAETHKSLVTATACYNYQSILNQEVCIEGDIYDSKSVVKVCEIKEITLSSQGGPVVISKISPTMRPNEDGTRITPHYRITVTNGGNGAVISTDSAKSCSSSSIDKTDINQIKASAKLFSRSLKCTPDTFRLDENNQAEFTCELTSGVEAVQDSYQSILIVELDYGYTFTISDEIQIEKRQI